MSIDHPVIKEIDIYNINAITANSFWQRQLAVLASRVGTAHRTSRAEAIRT
jgi:hypothetical protein